MHLGRPARELDTAVLIDGEIAEQARHRIAKTGPRNRDGGCQEQCNKSSPQPEHGIRGNASFGARMQMIMRVPGTVRMGVDMDVRTHLLRSALLHTAKFPIGHR